jgi:predicted secreted protein
MRIRELSLLIVALVVAQAISLGCSGGEEPLDTSAPATNKFDASKDPGGNAATDSATTKTD